LVENPLLPFRGKKGPKGWENLADWRTWEETQPKLKGSLFIHSYLGHSRLGGELEDRIYWVPSKQRTKKGTLNFNFQRILIIPDFLNLTSFLEGARRSRKGYFERL